MTGEPGERCDRMSIVSRLILPECVDEMARGQSKNRTTVPEANHFELDTAKEK